MNIKGLFSRRPQATGPDRARLAAIEWREFAPASFSWSDGDRTLQLTVQVSGMRFESGIASAELKVFDHELQVVCVLDGSEADATIYIGNWFIVPPPLRRRGLASAVLTACIQTFQHAAFGRVLAAQRVRLQGYFVGDGEAFARAVCYGIHPTKAKPAPLNVRRIQRSAQQLQIATPPLLLNGSESM